MKVRHRAAIAMASIVGGIAGCAWGLLIGSVTVLTVSSITFVLGFVYGHRLVYTLPDRPDGDGADTDIATDAGVVPGE